MPVFDEQQNKKKGSSRVPIVNEIVGRVNDNTKRLRLLEQRERLLTSRISSLDESVSSKMQLLEESLKEVSGRMTAIDEKVSTLNNTLKEVVKQLQFMARRSELKKVEETLKLFESALPQLVSQDQKQSK